jgi:lysozyme
MTDQPTALEIATALVCGFESFRAAPYQDTAGIWTIGYGSTRIAGQPVTADTPPVTEPQARALMLDELAPLVKSVKALGPEDASVNEVAACSSLAYNIGLTAFRGSTLRTRWYEEDPEMAAEHFLDWIFDHDRLTHQLVEVPGLKNRRLKEQAVFLGAQPGAVA